MLVRIRPDIFTGPDVTIVPEELTTVPLMCPLVDSLRFAVLAVPFSTVTLAEFVSQPDSAADIVYVPVAIEEKRSVPVESAVAVMPFTATTALARARPSIALVTLPESEVVPAGGAVDPV